MVDREFVRRRPVAVALTAAVALLALIESANALLAPLRAPTDADWRRAAADVRKGWQPGDLIVAAPDWADPVMRLHLGDLVPVPVAARMDDGRFSRVWEISQRGASTETSGNTAHRQRHGALTVRRIDRGPVKVTFDFFAEWQKATVRRVQPGRPDVACPLSGDKHQCPDIVWNFVQPKLLEIGTTLRNGLLCQPVANATVVVEFPAVPMGRELAVGAGLHHVWLRKAGNGTVLLRVLVDGQELGQFRASNRTDWQVTRFDTSRHAGKPATVRFEISAADPFARHFGFTAEARS